MVGERCESGSWRPAPPVPRASGARRHCPPTAGRGRPLRPVSPSWSAWRPGPPATAPALLLLWLLLHPSGTAGPVPAAGWRSRLRCHHPPHSSSANPPRIREGRGVLLLLGWPSSCSAPRWRSCRGDVHAAARDVFCKGSHRRCSGWHRLQLRRAVDRPSTAPPRSRGSHPARPRPGRETPQPQSPVHTRSNPPGRSLGANTRSPGARPHPTPSLPEPGRASRLQTRNANGASRQCRECGALLGRACHSTRAGPDISSRIPAWPGPGEGVSFLSECRPVPLRSRAHASCLAEAWEGVSPTPEGPTSPELRSCNLPGPRAR